MTRSSHGFLHHLSFASLGKTPNTKSFFLHCSNDPPCFEHLCCGLYCQIASRIIPNLNNVKKKTIWICGASLSHHLLQLYCKHLTLFLQSAILLPHTFLSVDISSSRWLLGTLEERALDKPLYQVGLPNTLATPATQDLDLQNLKTILKANLVDVLENIK